MNLSEFYIVKRGDNTTEKQRGKEGQFSPLVDFQTRGQPKAIIFLEGEINLSIPFSSIMPFFRIDRSLLPGIRVSVLEQAYLSLEL
ncbi:hypothetical protein M5689_011858 [Euphorbia peplus]|nr:hypothetical protein M5689_011858 [Euphorbia peplus]